MTGGEREGERERENGRREGERDWRRREREEERIDGWRIKDESEGERNTVRAGADKETVREEREPDKATEEESNHLRGLRVSVRLTHCPAAKTSARVSSSCVCTDERRSKFLH